MPLSPPISTFVLVSATRPMSSSTRSIGALFPMRFRFPSWLRSSVRSRRFSLERSFFSSAFSTTSLSSSSLKGLVM